MVFDPCPTALTSGRVASWKFAGETGDWLDLSGTYTLTNNATVQTLKASTGEGVIGPTSMCNWGNLEFWSTTASAILRNGSAATRCIVTFHRFSDFTAQECLNCPFSSDSTQLRLYPITTAALANNIIAIANGSSTSTAFGSFAFDEPILWAIKTDGTSSTTFQGYKISDSSQVYTSTIASAPGTVTTAYFGRLVPTGQTAYNSSEATLDMLQVFDSSLSDANLQSICEHIRNQQAKVQEYLRGHLQGLTI